MPLFLRAKAGPLMWVKQLGQSKKTKPGLPTIFLMAIGYLFYLAGRGLYRQARRVHDSGRTGRLFIILLTIGAVLDVIVWIVIIAR